MGSPSPTSLILTHRGDYFTVDRVLAELEARGERVLRLDTDDLGTRFGVQVEVVEQRPRVWLDTTDDRFDLSSVRAVWSRRVWAPELTTELPEARRHAYAMAHVNTLVAGLSLLDATWVNPWHAAEAAESKLVQLVHAKRLGFVVPPTVATSNRWDAAQLEQHVGPLVTKLLVPTVQSMEAHPDFVYTRKVSANDASLNDLRWGPRLFQPLVPKAREVRLIAVGARLFAASIDTQGIAHAQVDWRTLTKADGVRWQTETIPDDVATRVPQLLRALGLAYGALDFIITPDGRWVFLEVNPAGEWGWLEAELGLPIAAALADALTRKATT